MITCEIYVVVCENYVIICENYVIMCKNYVITCGIYVIICENYVIIYKNYVITCEIYVVTYEMCWNAWFVKTIVEKTGRLLYNVHNLNNGLLNKALLFCSRENQALLFDGVDDYVALPSVKDLHLTDRLLHITQYTLNKASFKDFSVVKTENGPILRK